MLPVLLNTVRFCGMCRSISQNPTLTAERVCSDSDSGWLVLRAGQHSRASGLSHTGTWSWGRSGAAWHRASILSRTHFTLLQSCRLSPAGLAHLTLQKLGWVVACELRKSEVLSKAGSPPHYSPPSSPAALRPEESRASQHSWEIPAKKAAVAEVSKLLEGL